MHDESVKGIWFCSVVHFYTDPYQLITLGEYINYQALVQGWIEYFISIEDSLLDKNQFFTISFTISIESADYLKHTQKAESKMSNFESMFDLKAKNLFVNKITRLESSNRKVIVSSLLNLNS